MSSRDAERAAKLVDALAKGRGQPPGAEDLEALVGATTPEVFRLLKVLENRRQVFRAGEHWFDASWIEDAKARLADFARKNGGFTPSDARTVLDTTRKWVIPLLEALDKAGFSRRVGEKRTVR
jgi:selenocysteine-specific elongation factor